MGSKWPDQRFEPVCKALGSVDFSTRPVPSSLAEADAAAPGMRSILARLRKEERRVIAQALGEAAITLHYKECDARMTGAKFSASLRKRVFVRSFRARLRTQFPEHPRRS